MSEQDVTLEDFTEVSDNESQDQIWEKHQLREFVKQLQAGGTPDTNKNEYYDGDIPWVKTGELGQLEIDLTEQTITKQGLEESTARLFPSKTVLIAMYGATTGEVSILDTEAATNQACCGIIPDERLNPYYLYYQLVRGKRQLESLSAGSGQQNISKSILEKYRVPVASLPEQRKIASVLYTVDRAIVKTEEIIDQTERFRRGYIKQQVLSLDSDCDRQEGAVGTRRVSIPDSWETVRLGDVARIVSGKSFPREYQEGHAGSRAVIKVEDMNLPGNDKYIEEVTNRVTDEVLDELSKNIFPENTVIHPRVGEALLLNKTRITGEDAAFDDNIMGWVPEGINPEYLYYASTLIDFNAVAQTGTVPSINKDMAANFRFPLPPEEEQKRIARDISRVDGQISIYEQEKKQLQRLKRGLMQDLLSGKVRTTDTNIEVPEHIMQHG